MKRQKPLKRKTPLRGNPATTRAWKDRSRQNIAPVSKKRAGQNRDYTDGRKVFLSQHPICPVTGDPATEIHHSAKRVGQWLNLKRYWIALSYKAHIWVEANKREAEEAGLMVRFNPNESFDDHIKYLKQYELDANDPVFYRRKVLYQDKLKEINAKIQ